jgi:hypothetical protein
MAKKKTKKDEKVQEAVDELRKSADNLDVKKGEPAMDPPVDQKPPIETPGTEHKKDDVKKGEPAMDPPVTQKPPVETPGTEGPAVNEEVVPPEQTLKKAEDEPDVKKSDELPADIHNQVLKSVLDTNKKVSTLCKAILDKLGPDWVDEEAKEHGVKKAADPKDDNPEEEESDMKKGEEGLDLGPVMDKLEKLTDGFTQSNTAIAKGMDTIQERLASLEKSGTGRTSTTHTTDKPEGAPADDKGPEFAYDDMLMKAQEGLRNGTGVRHMDEQVIVNCKIGNRPIPSDTLDRVNR